MDTAANNLANLDTPGFKMDRMVFRAALEGSLRGHRPDASMEAAVARTISHDMQAGRVTPTGRNLDVALPENNAFFAVDTPQGVRYTRAGNLHIMPDGALAGPDGVPYIGPNLRPIYLPQDANRVEILPTGELQIDGDTDGQRLMIVQFPNYKALQKEGNVLMRAPPSAGVPGLVEAPYVETQALEKSSDKAFKHMASVTGAARNFTMLTQVIEAFSNIEKKAASEIHGR